ncbi:hypothetical protein RhiirA4_545377 [Rhizophagus irregularis]|uniref:Uncharacterized protein n=1 Tax=Rhizophagus irregularis TaxID=588596 RepID=A0A2I1GSG3_9GLOM|nr:hypothetical protein RhiirA4_545377 [Rhizophagus irregularis]
MVKKSAEQGDVNTQLTIANLLREGKGVTKNETEAPKVQYNIGIMYLEGRILDKDIKTAIKLFESAAKQIIFKRK